MSAPIVQVESRGAVAVVVLNRPDASNTLNLQMAMDLLAAAMTCGRNPAVRAVVLTGAGRNFCFGGDLRGMLEKGRAAHAYLRELTTYLHEAISHFARMDAPLIAAVNGTAAGAGVGLVAASDLALCGESSKFNLAYTGVGLTPDAGTSFLLPRAIGTKRAMELFLLNRSITANEAMTWGLVNNAWSRTISSSTKRWRSPKVWRKARCARLAAPSGCWRIRSARWRRRWCWRAR